MTSFEFCKWLGTYLDGVITSNELFSPARNVAQRISEKLQTVKPDHDFVVDEGEEDDNFTSPIGTGHITASYWSEMNTTTTINKPEEDRVI